MLSYSVLIVSNLRYQLNFNIYIIKTLIILRFFYNGLWFFKTNFDIKPVVTIGEYANAP